jgi:hypothetical protein
VTYSGDGDSARAREELERAILAGESTDVLREKLHAFVSTFSKRPPAARVERIECTGVAASWCPVCGDCGCARDEDGELVDENVPNDECPLHGFRSQHAERNPAREEREALERFVIRALDQGQKPKCQRCGVSWAQGGNTACMAPESGFDHDWVLEVGRHG